MDGYSKRIFIRPKLNVRKKQEEKKFGKEREDEVKIFRCTFIG